jgi:signal transduction histidine kinase
MMNSGRTILVVSNDAALCAAARRTLEAKQSNLRVAAVSTLDAARRILADAAPAVILLEDTAVRAGEGQQADAATPPAMAERAAETEQPSALQFAVSALAAHAPVVVIGNASEEIGLVALVSAGVADFVARAPGHLVSALGFLEQRLRKAERLTPVPRPASLTCDPDGDAFGEVLRHELNNPLTGILGNAELLLAEVRRKSDGQFPNGGQQRLETIAALAVRLRETVRRLSQDWEARHIPVHQEAVRQRPAH